MQVSTRERNARNINGILEAFIILTLTVGMVAGGIFWRKGDNEIQ